MIAKQLLPNVYTISLGFVNVLLLNSKELTLIDTGIHGSEKKILQAIAELGYQPQDLRHILITHLHMDHIGSLAELQKATGAKVYMHTLEASAYSQANIMRSIEPAPGWINKLIVKWINSRPSDKTPNLARVDIQLDGGEVLPQCGGIQTVHTPGHTAGHLAFLWPQDGGLLFTGDAAGNMFWLDYSILYEDFAQGKKTLADLGLLEFHTACFSHGAPIRSGAAEKIRNKF
jgi:glyoxylase-like metal-dependent hydrolase (beta-lactamase superfamily II)